MAHIIADRVMETTALTGYGPITLTGPVAGYQAFSAVCHSFDTFNYTIVAVDTAGVPTGDWEVGQGVYQANGTLARNQVTTSSNYGGAVPFAAGTKQVFITLDASNIKVNSQVGGPEFYVSPSGSNLNPGSAALPFYSLQYALEAVMRKLDMVPLSNITVYLEAGTYTDECYLPPFSSGSTIMIVGDEGTPSNVVLTNSATSTILFDGPGHYYLNGVSIGNTCPGANGVYLSRGATLTLGAVEFTACPNAHVFMDNATLFYDQTCNILEGAPSHIIAKGGSRVRSDAEITFTGSPAFSTAYLNISGLSIVDLTDEAYVGSATGKMYEVTQNSLLITNSTPPGSVAGTVSTGGIFA